MPEGAAPIVEPGPQAPKPRVVQYRNRRYSIRLEPIFWQTLDRAARRMGLRLGRFIAELADRDNGPNFSSYLRVRCMIEAEQALARAKLGFGDAGQAGLVELVEASFAPGLVLSRYRTIVLYNGAFLEWIGRDRRPPDGADLTSVMQVRTRRSLNELWLEMLAGTLSSVDANVLRVEPGRVLTARVRLVALPAAGDAEFHAVMWLAPGRRAAPVPRIS